MVETSDEIRRELEITRQRMGATLAQLERKLNPKNVIRNHPLPILGVAFGAGVLLGTSKTDEGTLTGMKAHVRQGRARVNHSASHVVDEIIHGVQEALFVVGTAKLAEFLESLGQNLGASSKGGRSTQDNFVTSQRTPVPSGRRW